LHSTELNLDSNPLTTGNGGGAVIVTVKKLAVLSIGNIHGGVCKMLIVTLPCLNQFELGMERVQACTR